MDAITSADGTIITFERTGHGPPLVLVHGTGRDQSYWSLCLADLAQHTTVYAVDRRGRGSSGDTEAYAIEREVDDILSIIAAIDAPVFLLGHSYGAIVAMETALRVNSLRGLILYEPPFGVTPDQVPTDLGDRLDSLMVFGDREAVLVTFLQEGPRYPPDVIAAQRSQPDWPLRLAYAHTLPREVQAVNRYTFVPERFTKLQVPCLILCGSESPRMFRHATTALDTALPRSEVVVLQGQHHNAMLTAPTLFAATVHHFIQDHEHRDAWTTGP